MQKKTYRITIVRPGGNDTALVAGIAPKKKRKLINDTILQSFPNVEQVGFYEYNRQKRTAILEMAGGEFCGNATRSLAYLLLKGEETSISIIASGAKKPLRAGVDNKNSAFAEMPILRSPNAICPLDTNVTQVRLEGIVHLVIPTKSVTYSISSIETVAKDLLAKYGLLLSWPAAGVMFIEKTKDAINLQSVVWVRDVKTLFYETACASGTTAVGLSIAKNTKARISRFSIRQPSGEYIDLCIEKERNFFKKAMITGYTKILGEKEVIVYE